MAPFLNKQQLKTIALILLINFLLIPSVYAMTKVHVVYMGEKHHDDPQISTNYHHHILASVLGSKEAAVNSMIYSYKHGFSGFAAKLTKIQAKKIAELPGVIRVMSNDIYSSQTTRSWDYLGLSTNTPTNLLQKANMGDGVIIGILDTGIWPESAAFNDKGYGPIPSRWKGHCKSGQLFNAKTDCNNKLIGAKWFIDGFLAENQQPFNTTQNPDYLSPRDILGHGTQISSIAAGSLVSNASYQGLGAGILKGGAPRARIAMYKVLWNVQETQGSGSYADILKAFDEAIHDGVDLLSISMGRNSLPLFTDIDEHDGINIGSFHAVMKGIPVICSAGNNGPASQTVTNTAPWILTVAATTIDRSFPTLLTLGNNITIMGQAIYTGKEIGFTGLVYPQNPGLLPTAAGLCDSLSLNNTSVDGKVVICFAQGTAAGAATTALVTAASAVAAAGGVGVIAAANPNNILIPCLNDFPCIFVDYELGTEIMFYIRSSRSPVVKISPSKTLTGRPVSTKVAQFSSRGPSSLAPTILKPDIAAPGVSILTAFPASEPTGNGGFALASGTSVAAPHLSGIVALLKSLHPDWSPAAIKSAVVTTAWKIDPFGEPMFAEGSPRKLADPFDFGGGLVNPEKASEPGLVYDMGTTDYIHYLCSMGYNDSSISLVVGQIIRCPSPKPYLLDVNLPSITIPNLSKSVTLRRHVMNVGPSNSIYKASIKPPLGFDVTVTPNLLVFNSTIKTLSFKVTISTTHKVNSGFYFGDLTVL